MSWTPGLPPPGASLTLRVTFVDVHPDVIPVQLWGLVGQRREEYVRLSREIQEAAATRGPWALGGAPAAPGELCLVQVGLVWHRCRVVSRQAQESRVFLLDEGRTMAAGAGSLAPGRSEFFHLPSEVLGCVLAGLAPAGGGGAGGGEPQTWAPGAVDFLSGLQGQELRGRVLDVLLPYRLVLLEVPAVFQQMQELGLARQVPDGLFCFLLKRYLASVGKAASGTPVLPRVLPKPEPPGLDYFYPQLQLGVTEPVVVTQVCHPHRIHCQLRSLSQEIRRLSESMAQAYRASPPAARGTGDESAGAAAGPAGGGPGGGGGEEREESPDKPGSPCASCGLDGRWYRALLLETFRPQRCAQVLHVDYGRKELVSCSSLRYLLPEYFRMPVVTYPCALYGLWDCGRGWSRSQVGDLKALILGQAVNAKIEFYCSLEHAYYVTLYGEDGLNLNCAFGVQACCLADRFLRSSRGGGSDGEEDEEDEEEEEAAAAAAAGAALLLPPSPPPAEEERDAFPPRALRSIRLRMNAFYDAQVEFVQSPSEFWIRLRKHGRAFHRLARKMGSFYASASKLDGVVLRPEPDDLCCVKWKENGYFRATVTRLDGQSVDVFLVDRGNSETVDWYDVRMLLPQFRQLPVLALRCALADIWPLGKSWSQEAISFFKKTVLHKELVIHILDRQDHQYIIEILDESRTGEENISKVIAQAGYAKYQEFETQGNGPSPGQGAGAFLAESHKAACSAQKVGEQRAKMENKTSSALETPSDPAMAAHVLAGQVVLEKEKGIPLGSPPVPSFLSMKAADLCWKNELEVGTTVEVKVSCVENPSSFWCQLSKDTQGFRTLMCDIADYCENTPAPYQGITPACLAKRAESGKWSRALICGAPSSELVSVVFIDYGDKDTVPVRNIYAMTNDFLTVRAQAFRCSLYNLIQPTGENPFVWDEKAVQAFSGFVNNAWQNNLELKCTIFALASVQDAEPFNVVDLLTPFQSACHFLVEKRLARPVKLQKPLEASVRLHSYYYSTHDMKIGSEEAVYITHVDDPWTFYFQLARNSSVLEQLSYSITQLSDVLLKLDTSPSVPGNLCLAQYTDSNWYRGVIMEKDPNKVFFVDFGNIYVTNENLLPIPRDAYDVLLLPMQAVKCSLSDIPSHIPEEVTTWFQETVLDKSLKALVVAKDPDGRLIIELYDDSIQINASINEKVGLLGCKNRIKKKQKEGEAFFTSETPEEKHDTVKLSPTAYLSKSGESRLHGGEILGDACKPKMSSLCKEFRGLQSPAKTSLFPQYQDPVENTNEPGFPLARVKKDIFEDAPLQTLRVEGTLPERRAGAPGNKDLPRKLGELPKKMISPGLKTTVYVSHVNNISDFYVQLMEDEAEINQLSERLNNAQTLPQHYTGPPLQSGNVICALFPEDNLWYRAVVRERQPNDFLSVQFIDYGNVSVVHATKTGRLEPANALLPGLCVHCSLRGLCVPDIIDCKEITTYFSQRTDEAQMECEFIKFQDRWEVILTDDRGMIAEDVVNRYASIEKPRAGLATPIVKGDRSKSANRPDVDTSVFLNWYNPQMKALRAYATVIDGPEYFWCQFANTEELQYLETEVQNAGKQILEWRNRIHSPQIGDPCIVKYREDGHYYRALITSICEDDFLTVRLVDFGNMEDCVDPKAVWNIPGELLMVPMQAFPCCLAGFHVSGGACPQDGNDYFYEIVTQDVLEVTILEIQKDVCDIPLAIVDLRSRGESINEKMKKYAKLGLPKSGLSYEKKGPEVKGGSGPPSPGLGPQKPGNKAVQEQASSYAEPEPEQLPDRGEKELHALDAKPSKFYDLGPDCVFEASENSCKDHMASEVLEGGLEGPPGDPGTFEEKYLMAGFGTASSLASEVKELLEASSLELPLSPDEESREFLELEPMELQCSLVGDEDKEDLDPGPPPGSLSPGRGPGGALEPFAAQLSLEGEAEQQPELELPLSQPFPEAGLDALPARAAQQPQDSRCAGDRSRSSCAAPADDQHAGASGGAPLPTDESPFGEDFPTYRGRNAAGLPPAPLVPTEEPREGRKQVHMAADHISVQLQNTYTLKGFSVGSKCVVWSSLRNTWSKCEILEIAEEGTRVLNLSSGVEEVVSPENVWNGIPQLDKGPSEKRGCEILE
ncbi:tudor domain-containing protein 6 isoform X2 [Perognathus longimembris pacificus]|uniref:tudor domain-containing protein 6 isoform X2 n=1 Tax=Perognathus longimembris pacificus TaxID=214514 RepID=UPI002018A35B|nr:tudor domain-containing protein 6 isoform X2 [Perognathus longimembris pacificus]